MKKEANICKIRNPILWFKNKVKETKIFSQSKTLKFPLIKTVYDGNSETKQKLIREEIKESIINKENISQENIFKDAITVEINQINIKESLKNVEKINLRITSNENKSSELYWKQGDVIQEKDEFELSTALNLENGIRFLVKKFNDKSLYVKELEIIKALDSKHIPKILNYSEISDKFFIFTEYPSNGSLKNYIKCFNPLNEKIIKKITKQVLNIIDYLHQNGIVHLNLKSSDIFIDNDATCKITNFLYSEKINQMNHSFILDEFVKKDLLSFSMLIIELFTGISDNYCDCEYDSHRDVELLNHFINCPRKNENTLFSVKNFMKLIYEFYLDEKALERNLILNHEYLR